ncbi:MAG: hypothetical protein NC213_08025 [Acetobacter sp.]|nr:hypothetical protein [Bacteroides sp.]MCM1341676.1 hypothetical protein [Acetobacter sp.]MCM1434275.1 hypothetical protein [Clostridiales bacterium]
MSEIKRIYFEKLIVIIFRRGNGTKENPVRLVKQYRSLEDDKFLFEIDPFVNQD